MKKYLIYTSSVVHNYHASDLGQYSYLIFLTFYLAIGARVQVSVEHLLEILQATIAEVSFKSLYILSHVFVMPQKNLKADYFHEKSKLTFSYSNSNFEQVIVSWEAPSYLKSS